MRKVKLKDIANELGLSVPTVSRALGGFDDIAEETRILVRNKANEMGYRPNIHARSLVAKKSINRKHSYHGRSKRIKINIA
ncbi:MAG: LacI family DNA-binding transcriptional regulator [Calditrichales bacterium]|nr:LacI family DNA-binding transcriptional regulator [Calditrichales bacterium]